MTESQDSHSSQAETPDDTGSVEAAAAPPADGTEARRRSSSPASPVSWVALAVAVLALAAVVAHYWLRSAEFADSRRQFEAERSERAGRISELSAGLAEQRDRLDGLSQRLEELADASPDGQALRSRIDAAERELSRLETQTADRLDGMSDRLDVEAPDPADFRRRLLMQETLALLRLGQDRAQLAGDISGAVAAYTAAESRLAGIEDPRLGPVRRQLASELTALEAYTPVDWAARQGRLQALADGIEDWPVRGPGNEDAGAGPGEPGGDTADAGLWGRITGTLGDLVRIERSQPEWLTPVQASWLRAGLNVRFQIAELAAARGDAAAWRRALSDIRETMRAGLDLSGERMQRVIGLLDELAALPESGPEAELGEARRRLAGLAEAS